MCPYLAQLSAHIWLRHVPIFGHTSDGHNSATFGKFLWNFDKTSGGYHQSIEHEKSIDVSCLKCLSSALDTKFELQPRPIY